MEDNLENKEKKKKKERKKKLVTDYNPQHKIRIHKFILI
jgi:hypothetical protein